MDTFPVGREFGSPDYDRLMAEDAKCFNRDLLAWIEVANHSTDSEKIAHATQEFSGDIHNIQDALKSLGQEVSIETAASVWIHYSKSLCAGWMSGADSIDSAAKTLFLNCPRRPQHSSA